MKDHRKIELAFSITFRHGNDRHLPPEERDLAFRVMFRDIKFRVPTTHASIYLCSNDLSPIAQPKDWIQITFADDKSDTVVDGEKVHKINHLENTGGDLQVALSDLLMGDYPRTPIGGYRVEVEYDEDARTIIFPPLGTMWTIDGPPSKVEEAEDEPNRQTYDPEQTAANFQDLLGKGSYVIFDRHGQIVEGAQVRRVRNVISYEPI